jgi:hypothetical protein
VLCDPRALLEHARVALGQEAFAARVVRRYRLAPHPARSFARRLAATERHGPSAWWLAASTSAATDAGVARTSTRTEP